MEEKTNLQIERYLGNTMSVEERKNFEAELKINENLRQEVLLSKEINLHLNPTYWSTSTLKGSEKMLESINNHLVSAEAKELKRSIQEASHQYRQSAEKKVKAINNPNQKPENSRSLWTYVGIVAAVFVFGVLIYNFSKPTDYNELYVEYYTPDDLTSVVTRGSENTLQRGASYYQQEKYNEAAQQFQDYLQIESQPNPVVYSYYGMTQLALNKPKKALELFNTLQQTDSFESEKANWYKALVYLKTKDKKALKETLNTITSDATSFNYEKAKSLAKEL